MRNRIIFVILALWILASLAVAQDTPAPDFNATATAIIVGATQTAVIQEATISSTPTQDPFIFTVTARVRDVTRTAEASTGRTSVPVTAAPQGDTFSLTATALVKAATVAAAGDTGSGTSNDVSNHQALSLTLLAFGGLIVVLVILGFVVVFVGRKHPAGKRK